VTDARTYLAGIKERADAATAGPWRWDESFGDEGDTGLALTSDSGAEVVGAYNHHCCSFRDDPSVEDNDAEFIAHSRTDLPRVADALLAVLELHKVETRWTHPEWTGSFDTREEAAEYDYDEAMGDVEKSHVGSFEICAECGRVESEQLSDAGDGDWSYRESLWPCRTVKAITEALEPK